MALGHPWTTIAAVSALVLLVQIPLPHATAWHFFEDAVDLLFSGDPGGALSLYGDRPDLQFGPLSIVVAIPFTLLGSLGSWSAMVVFSALGVGVVWMLRRALGLLDTGRSWEKWHMTDLLAAALFVVVWGDVAVRTAHIDDAITLAAAAAGVLAVAHRRPGWVVIALAVAAAAKPWGLIFAPLAAALPDRRLLRVTAVVVLAGLTWLPFIIAEPATLDASSFEIANETSSSLRALGITSPTTPAWVRPAQLIGGFGLAAVLVWKGRWTAALMAGVAFRLLIDPAANRYYTVGLVLGLLVFELHRRPRRFPWFALVAAVVLEFGQYPWFPPALSGWLRLIVTVAVLLVAVTAGRRATGDRRLL